MTDMTASAEQEKEDIDALLGVPAKPWYKRPAVLAAIAIGALLVIFLLWRLLSGETAAGYATAEVRRGDLTVTVTATGNLQPTNQVEVGSEQSGLITEVYVDNNDRVTQGQPLARLDPQRLNDAIRQAQASLAAAQAQVGTANATLVQARANLGRLEEVRRLSAGKVPSQTELDTGRAELQRAQAGLRAAEAQVQQQRAALSSAQFNLSRATIYSPVNGVVLSRSVDPGQTVAASFQAPVLFTIAEDLSQMQLDVKVDEADVGQVKAGQRATFTVDAFPGRTFPAQIERVDVGANASSSSTSSAATSTNTVVAYTAVLSVENPEQILRPGMTATAEIITNEQKNQLLVPNAALRYSPEREAASAEKEGSKGGVTSVLGPPRRRGDRPERETTIGRGSRQTVYVLDAEGKAQPIQVTTGASNGRQTAVSGPGLRSGMKVITGRLAPSP